MKKSALEQLYQELVNQVKKDPAIVLNLKRKLKRIIHDVFNKFVSEQGGYCSKFKIPTSDIEKLSKLLKISEDDIRNAFVKEWKLPHNQHNMYANIFYHNLLLIFIYGIRNNEPELAKNALAIILFRMWNGRLSKAIQYCDKDTMDYVVNYMGEARHLWKKYKSPLNLILDYFVPTLYKKYAPLIKNDLGKVKLFFNQIWGRLYQLFYQNFGPSLDDPKKSHAKSGLAVLYYKAKSEGRKMSKAGQYAMSNEEEPGFETKMSSSEIQNISNNITNSIVMNYKPEIDKEIVTIIRRDYKLNEKGVKTLIELSHSNKFAEEIHDIISLIITHIQTSKKKLCDIDEFNSEIKKKIIGSKHSSHNVQLKKTIDLMLTRMFHSLNLDYNRYSLVRKSQLRAAIILIFANHIRAYLCE